MAVGIVAIFNGSYHSPGFDITVSGLSGFDTLTVERIDVQGEYPDTPVRGADAVAVNGESFAITDFEAPIGRNVVYRATAGTSTFTDTFTRTVTNGWGDPWAIESGTPSHFSTTGSVARQQHTAVNESHWTSMDARSSDIDVFVDLTVALGTATGAPLNHAIVMRETDLNNHYRVIAELNTSGQMTIALAKNVGGVFVNITGATTVSGHFAGAVWRIRGQINGYLFRAKMWLASGAEPAAWQVSTTLANEGIDNGKKVALRSRFETGNTNVLPQNVDWDNFTVTSLNNSPAVQSVGTSSAVGVLDAFTRVSANGWGTPEVGAPWAIRSGVIADFLTTGSVARMSMTQRSVNASFGTEYVAGSPLNHTDVDLLVKTRSPGVGYGDTLRAYLIARGVDDNTFVNFELGFRTDLSVYVALIGRLNGAHQDLVSETTIAGLTHEANAWYWIRFQVVGDEFRGKAWKDGTTEPVAWQIVQTVPNHPSGVYVAAKAFSSAFFTSPTPTIVDFDDFSAVVLDLDTLIPAEHSGVAWLKSVGQPALSKRVNISEFSDRSRPGRVLSEYEVLGRSNKVVLKDVLGGREGTLSLVTFPVGGLWESDSSWRDVELLLAKGGTLLLQTAGTTLTGEDDVYLEVTDYQRKRIGVVGGELVHLHSIEFVEVDRPATTQQALSLRDWQSVLDQNASWQDVLTNHSSWLDVLQRDL